MNSNYNLNYPSANDYYDINIFNNNFSKLADGIDDAKAGGYKNEVIVAAYNSKSPLKDCADFVCTQDDCTSILNSAVTKAYEGGTIRFLDGDYYLTNILEIRKSINIKGDGKYSTILHKKGNYAYLLKHYGSKSHIEKIGFECNTEALNLCLLLIGNNKIEIDDCYFNVPIDGGQNDAAPITIDYDFGYTAIRNCLFEKYKNTRFVVQAENSQWRGIMTGNFVTYIPDHTQIPVAVNLKNSTSHNEVDFGSQKTTIYIKGVQVS